MRELLAKWKQWSDWYAARVPRERGLIAGGGIAAVVLLVDAFALSPLAIQHKRLTTQLNEARNTIKAGEQLLAAGRGAAADPDEVKRRYRDALRQQIAEIDGKLQGLQKQLVPPDQVTKLLEGVLSRERGPALVSLRKLPVQQFQAGGTAPKADSKAPVAAGDRNIFQHSFEIEVEGSYVELQAYLAKLEKLPWQLFWGKVALDAGGHPRLKLSLTVHTLSLNQAWLVV